MKQILEIVWLENNIHGSGPMAVYKKRTLKSGKYIKLYGIFQGKEIITYIEA